MKQFLKKSLLSLVLAGMLSSSLGIRPAEARSRRGRTAIIVVGVVALVALVSHHSKKNHVSGTTLTDASQHDGVPVRTASAPLINGISPTAAATGIQ